MITEIIIMLIISFFIAFALNYASKIFKEDDNFEKIRSELPGANCGACGFAGCNEYARMVAKNPTLIGKCLPGGKEVADKLSNILGVNKTDSKSFVASVKCKGGINCNDKGDYMGEHSCKSSAILGGGQKECSYGCLGFGDCVKVCKFNALKMGKDNIPIVDYNNCVGCGCCVNECPKQIFELIEKKKKLVDVNCKSKDKGNVVVKKCKNGCIACRTCERNCPTGAIVVKDNLAEIDQSKCISCGLCVKNCPRKIISFKIKS